MGKKRAPPRDIESMIDLQVSRRGGRRSPTRLEFSVVLYGSVAVPSRSEDQGQEPREVCPEQAGGRESRRTQQPFLAPFRANPTHTVLPCLQISKRTKKLRREDF